MAFPAVAVLGSIPPFVSVSICSRYLGVQSVRAQLLQRCPLCDPMDCGFPGCRVLGTLEARIAGGLPSPSPGGLPGLGLSPCLLRGLPRRAGSLPPAPPGSLPAGGCVCVAECVGLSPADGALYLPVSALFRSPFCLSTAAPVSVISIHMKCLSVPHFLSLGCRLLSGFLSRHRPSVFQGKPPLPQPWSRGPPPPAPSGGRPPLGLPAAAPPCPGQRLAQWALRPPSPLRWPASPLPWGHCVRHRGSSPLLLVTARPVALPDPKS